MKYLEDVLIQPLISEKSYDRIADSNSYTFFVHTISHDTYSEMLPQTILLVFFLPSVKVSSHQHCIIKQKQKAIKVILRHTQDVHFSIDI